MKNLFSEANKAKVDAWLNDPTFQGVVEKDLGPPIKVKVLWEKGTIEFRGSREGSELQIQDILSAYGAQHLN